jgi:2-isopropylmalate synthase
VSANVIDASYNALHDSITYRLFRAASAGTQRPSADSRH